MIYRFTFTQEDYIESNALQKANARENRGVYHLVLLLGLGCIAYLNTAVFRSALTYNDTFSYGVGIVVAVLFLLQYSPRIIPSLIIPLQLKYGRLPKGLLGPRSFEIADDRLIFTSSVARVSFGYDALTRVNHSDKIVLFYFENGTVHPVPLRALGQFSYERTEVLEGIQKKAAEINEAGTKPSRTLLSKGNSFSCQIRPDDVLRANQYELFLQRRKKVKDPFSLFTLAFILYCIAGGIYGLVNLDLLPESLRGYLTVFLILELLGAAIAMLIWFKPAFLAQYTLKQMLKAGQYFPGYIGDRIVSWDEKELEIAYASNEMYFPYSSFTVVDDGQELLFLQDENLVFFLPKKDVPGRFIQALENYQKNRIEEKYGKQ